MINIICDGCGKGIGIDKDNPYKFVTYIVANIKRVGINCGAFDLTGRTEYHYCDIECMKK